MGIEKRTSYGFRDNVIFPPHYVDIFLPVKLK